jgi:hypothetical protein
MLIGAPNIEERIEYSDQEDALQKLDVLLQSLKNKE